MNSEIFLTFKTAKTHLYMARTWKVPTVEEKKKTLTGGKKMPVSKKCTVFPQTDFWRPPSQNDVHSRLSNISPTISTHSQHGRRPNSAKYLGNRHKMACKGTRGRVPSSTRAIFILDWAWWIYVKTFFLLQLLKSGPKYDLSCPRPKSQGWIPENGSKMAI